LISRNLLIPPKDKEAKNIEFAQVKYTRGTQNHSRLEREGLFRSEVSGRQKYFQLSREYPLFDEVPSIVAKTIGAVPLITQSLRKVKGIDEDRPT
jgi:hypothetical protein